MRLLPQLVRTLVLLTLHSVAHSFAATATAAAVTPLTTGSLANTAKEFYTLWNDKKVDEAMTLFADDVHFVDGQYSEPFRGKEAARAYIQECADSLVGWNFIIDDYAEDLQQRKLGLKWHVEGRSGMSLPFPTNGLTFMKFSDSGLISECTDMIEATVKTGPIQLPLLRLVSKVLRIK